MTRTRLRLLSLAKFFVHPGTWVFLTLLAVGMGILFPIAAPALIITAGITIWLAAITTLVHLGFYWRYHFFPKLDKNALDATLSQTLKATLSILKEWADAHTAQAIIVGIGIGLFITALVLTIGFFTGGAAFAFMAPVFATIAAPFATAAAAAGLKLSIAALAGTTFILASLNITDIFKRLAAWLDSFRYDYAAAVNNKALDLGERYTGYEWKNMRKDMATQLATLGRDTNSVSYIPAIGFGMAATIGNFFLSPDKEKLNPASKSIHSAGAGKKGAESGSEVDILGGEESDSDVPLPN